MFHHQLCTNSYFSRLSGVITTSLLDCLHKCGLGEDVVRENFLAIACDWARAMLGRKSGVIRRFEDTIRGRQDAGEDLGPFMSRLRRLAGFAFIQENEDSRRSRIIWKFVSEIREESVRRNVIRQKWIGADGKAVV